MAESLEGRVRRLKSRLESLQELYSGKERPIAVDMEMEIIQDELENLVDTSVDRGVLN